MRFLLPLLALIIPALSYGQASETLYVKHCAECHHEERIGRSAPPLLPINLKQYRDADIIRIVKDGLPATMMPSFKGLGDKELLGIVGYLRKEAEVQWTKEDVEGSLVSGPDGATTGGVRGPGGPGGPEDITAVVERGGKKVWIMDRDELVDSFEAANVHGGIKFSYDGARVFVPSRDGWIGAYDLTNGGLFKRVRACVYLRGIAVSSDGRFLIASCWLPSTLVVLSAQSLNPVRLLPVEGKISAVYELFTRDRAVFTFRDLPLIGSLDTKSLEVSYIEVGEPVRDFFVDPFERFIVGSFGKGGSLGVFDLTKAKKVFEYPLEGMPHLASAAPYYHRGEFYFATPHIGKPYISVWRMYDWDFVGKIETGGDGFFVRTHPRTPYLWTDDGGDSLVLIEKRGFSVKKIVPEEGKRVIHTGFSGDGTIAYVSVYDPDGYLVLYDSQTLEEIKRIPANVPVGKYNTKTRGFAPSLLGREVFMEKCWGCHHPTREAFGPSLEWIAVHREDAQIKAHILDPERTYRLLGYEKNAMPKISLSEYELEALLSFIKGGV
jgi:mono/diheme cytochrome c family protein